MFRELRLMKERSAGSVDAPHLPERLGVLVSQIGTRFNGLGPGMDDLWQTAVDNKVEFFDWTVDLPQAAVVAVEFYDALLDEADEFGLAQRLLTLPASPSSVAVRRWFLSELTGQLHGKAPCGLGRQPVPCRPAGRCPLAEGTGQRFLAVAFFSTLP